MDLEQARGRLCCVLTYCYFFKQKLLPPSGKKLALQVSKKALHPGHIQSVFTCMGNSLKQEQIILISLGI